MMQAALALVALLAVAILYWMVRLIAFPRSGGSPPAGRGPARPAEDPERRDRAIEELEERLKRVRAKAASLEDEIARDPARAAQVLRKMMQRDRR